MVGRNALYLLVIAACLTGYVWLFYNIQPQASQSVEVCIIKHTLDIPCPSCGSTRSVASLLHGEFLQAFWYNPFGYLLAAIMAVAPLWILLDTLRRKSSFHVFYRRLEAYIRKPALAIPLVLVVLVNWIWNIIKYT